MYGHTAGNSGIRDEIGGMIINHIIPHKSQISFAALDTPRDAHQLLRTIKQCVDMKGKPWYRAYSRRITT